MNLEDRISHFASMKPRIAATAYIAPGANIVGAVEISSGASVWFQATLRADLNSIYIGTDSNVQDGAVIHVADDYETHLGERVTVGHCAVLHACNIDDEVLVGMNSVILDGARIGARSIIGANALVTAGTVVPAGSLFLGSPGKVVRQLSIEEQKNLASWAHRYVTLAEAYRSGRVRVTYPRACASSLE